MQGRTSPLIKDPGRERGEGQGYANDPTLSAKGHVLHNIFFHSSKHEFLHTSSRPRQTLQFSFHLRATDMLINQTRGSDGYPNDHDHECCLVNGLLIQITMNKANSAEKYRQGIAKVVAPSCRLVEAHHTMKHNTSGKQHCQIIRYNLANIN